MRSQTLDEVLRPAKKKLTVMWAGLLSSVVMYVIVAWVVIGDASDERVPIGQELILGLGAAAVLCAVFSRVLPTLLLSDERLRERMQAEDFDVRKYLVNPQMGKVDQARVDKASRLPELEQRLATLPSLHFAPWVMGAAMAEAVAVYGFVLALVTRDLQWMFPFAAASFVLLALKRPSFDALMDRARRFAR
jgi:hypothetical protein